MVNQQLLPGSPNRAPREGMSDRTDHNTRLHAHPSEKKVEEKVQAFGGVQWGLQRHKQPARGIKYMKAVNKKRKAIHWLSLGNYGQLA